MNKRFMSVLRVPPSHQYFFVFKYALKTKIYAAAIEGLPEKYAVIGFDRAGNPLEVMYNPIDDNTINVFHAMKARKSFIKMLGI